MWDNKRKVLPVGIDKVIDQIQLHLAKINIPSDVNAVCFPRIVKLTNDTIPLFNASKKEYQDALFDDRNDLTVFFVADHNTEFYQSLAKRGIGIVFQCRLEKFMPEITDRVIDEDITVNFLNYLKESNYYQVNWQIKSIDTDLRVVYREFSLDSVDFENMASRSCFRINLID